MRIIVYSSFLNVGMLKCTSREDRRVKNESMLGLELSVMKYYSMSIKRCQCQAEK